MADYFNTAWVTDVHAKKIVAQVDLTETLTQLDEVIDGICQVKGVPVASIPVDGTTGYITSTRLIQYSIRWLYVKLFGDYWGSANGLNDIYYEKLQFNVEQLGVEEGKLTYENIISNDPITPTGSIGMAVRY